MAPRDRKKGNHKLPPHVYKDRSRYYYRPYLGAVNGKAKYDKPVRLAALDAPLSQVWKAYEIATGETTDTLKWLLKKYLQSPQFSELSAKTQRDYEAYADKIKTKKLADGSLFGDVQLSRITEKVIRNYLDNYPAKVSANRHVQFLKAAYNWGIQRYDEVTHNPCKGVTLNKEQPRDRFIADWEYAVLYECAKSARVPIIAPAMELSYLCRARRGEVFALRETDLTDEGIYLERGKGSENEITLWSVRLKKAVDMCRAIYPDAPSQIKGSWLLHDKRGKQYTKNAIDSAWQRVLSAAMSAGAVIDKKLLSAARKAGAIVTADGKVKLTTPCTFHDIKARGITEHKDHHGGHKSKKMERVYNRKAKRVEATE